MPEKPTDTLLNPAEMMTFCSDEVSVGTLVSTWTVAATDETPVQHGINDEHAVLSMSQPVAFLNAADARELARLLLNAAEQLDPQWHGKRAHKILTDEFTHDDRPAGEVPC